MKESCVKTLNILLVEDSPLDAELIEAYLTEGGIEFSLICVETRSDFVAALEQNCFDIILADYMLPCFNGIAALEIARETCPGVPFIFVSATLGEEVAIETLKSGATDYVLKRRLARLVPSIERALREVQERLELKQAQAQRQESEERFRIMADTAPVMIWMSGANKLCDYCNKVWLEFTGRTLAQETGKGWMESLHPDDLQHFLDVSNSAFEARVECRMEFRLRRADGEYRWILSTGVPRYRRDRTFAGYIGSCIDISDRKLAEQEKAAALEREQAARVQAEEIAQELLKANQRISNILESITDGFVAVDDKWRFTYANRKAVELLGKSQTDCMSKTMWELLPCSPESKCYAMARQAVAERVTLEYEEFDRTLNKWFNVRLYPSELGVSAYFQDITARKQTEAALQASEAKLRFLAEANLIGILFSDIYGGISNANDEFLRIVGYTREQLQRGEMCWRDITPPEYLPLDEIGIAQAQATGACTPYEKEYQRPDGSRISVLIGYVLLGEKREEAVAFVMDLSERKHLEAQLRDRAEELDRVNRIKDEFLATLSHELRTPLNAMLGWTQLLRYRKFDEQTTVRALETIDRNTRSLAALIEDLLDLSRIVTGKLSLNLRSVDAIATVEAAIDTLAPAAQAKNIEIVTDFDPATGRIYGDAGRLQQVAWNLLSNAIKFTPEGGQVTVTLRKLGSPIACKLESGENLSPATVEIEVSDTGEGIEREFLPRVFDRFSQADSTSSRSHNGLGLGLAIVRHLVELHGGTVQAESAGKGQGARFCVRLPVKQPEGDRAFAVAGQEKFLVPEKRAIASVRELTASANLSGLRVLVVDDDWDSLDFARAILEDCRAQVETADSARQALEAIKRRAPDILVSDISMPVENGCTLLQQIRAIERGSAIPAVALTAHARVEERVRALREGFQIHLPKPIEPAELVAVVASLAARDR
ncbi:MAG: PAS domain S-box protein [Oscillatoriaceae cyanobacterium Prado104]|jgi:PAS domain S-box-containing protein|nr:PAS domain S-box protein [Oscillatoriaceae cyanobacterium Prado104]